jgi:hypothetical protein
MRSLEVASCPCHPHVDVCATEVHSIPGKHIRDVVRLLSLIEDCIKQAEDTGSFLGLLGAVWEPRWKHVKHLAAFQPARCPSPAGA